MNLSEKSINDNPDHLIDDKDELIHVLQKELGDDAETWNYTLQENGTLVFSSTSTGKLLTIVGFEKMKNHSSNSYSKESSQSTENLSANVSSCVLQDENECVWETRSSDHLNIILCPSLKRNVFGTHKDGSEAVKTCIADENIPDTVSTPVASGTSDPRTPLKKLRTSNKKDSNLKQDLTPKTTSAEQLPTGKVTDSPSSDRGKQFLNTSDEKKLKSEKVTATNVIPQQWDLSETLFNKKENFGFKGIKKKSVQNSLQRPRLSKNNVLGSPKCKQTSCQDSKNNRPISKKDMNGEKKTKVKTTEFNHVQPLNGLGKNLCVDHEKEMMNLEDSSISNIDDSFDSIDISYKMSLKEFTHNWNLEQEKSQHNDSPFARGKRCALSDMEKSQTTEKSSKLTLENLSPFSSEKMVIPSDTESSQNSVKSNQSSFGNFAQSPKQSLTEFLKSFSPSRSEIGSPLPSSSVKRELNSKLNKIKPLEDLTKKEMSLQESQAEKYLVNANKKSTEGEDEEYYDIEVVINKTENSDFVDPSIQNGEGIIWDQPFRPHPSKQSGGSICEKTDVNSSADSIDLSQTSSSDNSFVKKETACRKKRLNLRTLLKYKCYPSREGRPMEIKKDTSDIELYDVGEEKNSAPTKESKVISLKRGLSKFSMDEDTKISNESQNEWRPPSKLQEISKSETLAIRISNPVKTGVSQRMPLQKSGADKDSDNLHAESNKIVASNSPKVLQSKSHGKSDTQIVVQQCSDSAKTVPTASNIQTTRFVVAEKFREDPRVAKSQKQSTSERESSDDGGDLYEVETNCPLDSDIDAWSASSNVSKPIASRDPRKAWRIPKPNREEEATKEAEPTYSYPLTVQMQQKILSCGPKRWFDKLVKYYIEISSGGSSMVHPLYIQDISKALRLSSNNKNLHQSFESFIRTLEQLKGVVQKGSQLPLIDRNNIAWIGVTLLRVAQMSNQWKEGYQILYHMHEKEIPYHIAVVNKNMSQLDIIELAFQFCYNTDQPEAAIQILEGTQWLIQMPKGKKLEIDHRKRRIFLLQKLLWKLLSEIQGDELEGDGLGRQKFLFELSNTVFEKMLVTGPEDMQKLENYNLKRYYNLVLSSAIKVQEHDAAWMLFKSFLKTSCLEPTKVNIRKLLSLLGEHSQYDESLLGRALTVVQAGIKMGLYPAQNVGKEKGESEVQLWAGLTTAEMYFLIYQLLLAKKNQLGEIVCVRDLESLDFRMKITVLSNTFIPTSYQEAFNSVELQCTVPTAIGKVRRVLERQLTPKLDIHSVSGGTIRLTIQTVQNFTASLQSSALAYQY